MATQNKMRGQTQAKKTTNQSKTSRSGTSTSAARKKDSHQGVGNKSRGR